MGSFRLSRSFVAATTDRLGPILATLAPILMFVAGCSQGPGTTEQTAPKEKKKSPARSEVERGPVRVVAEVEPGEAKFSDQPVLTLTIDYQKGVTVTKPPFGDALGDFLVRDFREPMPRTEGDREIRQQIYTLEPMRTGELPIAPIRVTFTDTRPDGDGKEHAIQTEGITVKIASVVGSEMPSLADLRPLAGPVAVPETAGGGWWLWWLFIPAAAAAGGIGWYLWRRRRKTEQPRELSAEERAYLELQRIIEQEWAERDVKQFYVELTGVVRRYLERSKGVHAPEQTTEEFLREISARNTFPAEQRGRLKWFLESADLVKFAAHEPRKEDIEESFRRAKVFIGLERWEAAA